MQLNLLLKCLNLGDPGDGILRLFGEQSIPTVRCIRRRECAEELEDPLEAVDGTEALADPVTLRVCGTTGVRLYEGCAVETHGERPDEFEGRAALHVEEFEDHCAARFKGGETGQCFGDEETLDRVFLAIEVGAEVEAAVGCIDTGFG